MKLPFISRKHYDNLYNNYCVLSDARKETADEFEKFQKGVLNLLPKRIENTTLIGNLKLCIDDYNAKIITQKEEIKKLKTLLTRNKISYDKVVKK